MRVFRSRTIVLIFVIAIFLELGGCGGSNSSNPTSGGGGGGAGNPPPPPPPPATGQFLFAPLGNAPTTSNTRNMAEYKIDPSSGALTTISTSISTQNQATFSTTDPGRNVLYVIGNDPSFTFNLISGFAVDINSGAITPMPGSPFSFNHQQLGFMTIRPDDKFAYVDDFMNTALLHIISMNAGNGLQNEVATVTVPSEQGASNIMRGLFDSSGAHLYLVNAENNTIAGYSSDPVTGQLTPIPGSPFTPHGAKPGGCSPKQDFCGGEVAITGSRLYYVSQFFDGVAEFNIDGATGALTEAPSSPIANPAHGAYDIKVTPDGRFLYVFAPNFNTSMIIGYAVDGSTGNLTQVPGSPLTISGLTFFVDLDGSGQFLYASGHAGAPALPNDSIYGYRIDPTSGALSPVAGSPFAAPGVTGVTVVH